MIDLFLFDAFTYSYFLHYQIGVMPAGRKATLNGYELSFLKNKESGFAKAALSVNPKGKIYGVVYALTNDQLKVFNKKVLNGFRSELMDVVLLNGRPAKAMVPIMEGAELEVPYQWYVDLMIAGMKEIQAPVKYIEMLMNIKGNDEFHVNSIHAKSVLNYHRMYKKYLNGALEQIERICAGGNFLAKSKVHPFNGREFKVAKDEKGFRFDTTTKIKKGTQDVREFIIGNPELLLSDTYRVKRKMYVVDRVSYGDDVKYISGSIQGIEDKAIEDKPYYWRLMVPIPEGMEIMRNFEWWKFLLNGRPHSELIRFFHEGNEVHFYGIKRVAQNYAVFEVFCELPLKRFQEICYALILVYALLKGKFYSGEGFFIAYMDTEFTVPKGVVYQIMHEGMYNLGGMFTTNAYTGIEQTKYRRNNKGGISQKLIKERKKGLDGMSAECFGNLVNLLLEKDKIRESLTQIILNQQATLEIKIPVLYVALETISGSFSIGGDKDLKPIKDNKIAGKLTKLLRGAAEKFAGEEGFNAEQLKAFDPLLKRLDSLNNPPNADKLSKVFDLVGYVLKPVDKIAINERNAFLHGFTPRIKVSTDDYGFREFYDLSLRLQFLLSVLLLKKAGFTGKLINYNKLYEHITQIVHDEDVFIMI